MNRDSVAPETADEKLLDLLVDGELDAARRRELFAQLDATSGGWRQCALAFLEAQAWRSDLQRADRDSHRANVRDGNAAPVKLSLFHRLRNWSLLATSVACAFVAGWICRPTPAGPVTAGPVAPAAKIIDQRPVATLGPDDETSSGEKSPDKADSADVRVAGIVTLKFDDHGQERELQLPVLEGRGIDLQQWLKQPPAVSASAVEALERRGHKVETHRQLLTVNLKDGRKLLLPVDQVDVRVAHRVYQ